MLWLQHDTPLRVPARQVFCTQVFARQHTKVHAMHVLAAHGTRGRPSAIEGLQPYRLHTGGHACMD